MSRRKKVDQELLDQKFEMQEIESNNKPKRKRKLRPRTDRIRGEEDKLEFYHIAAISGDNWVIGGDGWIPWMNGSKGIKEDLKHFRNMTKNGLLVMGRGTWEGIKKDLGFGRKILVLTRREDYESGVDGVEVVNTWSDVKKYAIENGFKKVWICGGEEVYKNSMGFVSRVYLTKIWAKGKEYKGDRIYLEGGEEELRKYFKPLGWTDVEDVDGWGNSVLLNFIVYIRNH